MGGAGGGKINGRTTFLLNWGNNFEAWDCCSSLTRDRPTPESKLRSEVAQIKDLSPYVKNSKKLSEEDGK